MKPYTQAIGTDDRISAREELGQVIGLLIDLRQLPAEASLQILENSTSRPHVETDRLWTVADYGAGPGVTDNGVKPCEVCRRDQLGSRIIPR